MTLSEMVIARTGNSCGTAASGLKASDNFQGGKPVPDDSQPPNCPLRFRGCKKRAGSSNRTAIRPPFTVVLVCTMAFDKSEGVVKRHFSRLCFVARLVFRVAEDRKL